ncbi:MAG: aminotransferase class I/II-fold pyridoxal phosphate-dependent enzyme, partial [Bacilli bacterium]
LAAEKQNVRVVCNPLVIQEGRYHIDWAHLEQQLREERPKLMIFCTPHNPSGRIWSLDEMTRVATLCQTYGTILIADEVHGEHILTGEFHSSLLLDTSLFDNLIVLTSPNKAFNLGGLKTSYSMIPGERLRSVFRAQLDKNSITSPNMFGVAGIVASYNDSRDWLDEVTAYIKGNYDYMEQYFAQHLPAFRTMPMEASYVAWIDVSDLQMPAEIFVKELAVHTGVILEAGINYVQNGDSFIRMNLGTQRHFVEEALQRIHRFVNERKIM